MGCVRSESTGAFQMLFAGNIGQFAIVGPLPPGVDGITVSAGETVPVSVGAREATMGATEAGTQADSNQDKMIKSILILMNRPALLRM